MIANNFNVKQRTESIAVVDQNNYEDLRRRFVELEGIVRSMKDVIKLSLHCNKKVCLDNLPLPIQQEILAELESDTEKELVLKLIQRRKFDKDWYSLPEKWKHDVPIACAYFDNQPRGVKRRGSDFTFDFSDDDRRDLQLRSLPYSLRINKEVILSSLRTSKGASWDDVHARYRTDIDVIATAVANGKLKFEKVPLEIVQSREEIALYGVKNDLISADVCPCLTHQILKENIENGVLDWYQLPQTVRDNMEFAMAIEFDKIEDKKRLYQQLFHHFEELRHDKMFWWRWHESLCPKEEDREWDFIALFEKYCPADLLADENFVTEFCAEYASIYKVIAEQPFATSRHFLETIINRNPEVLQYFSHQTQVEHLDLVFTAIKRLGILRKRTASNGSAAVKVHDVATSLVPEFWSSFRVAMAWVKAGHGFPTHALSGGRFKTWMANRQLCLASAINAKTLYYTSNFRDDIDFMIQVVTQCPQLYLEAGDEVAADPVVMTIAFAGLLDLASQTMDKLHFDGHDDKIQSYLSFLNSKLEMYDTFVCCILGNMLSTQSVETTGSSLTLLNQGHETSIVYKRLLADNLGIPTGKWLCQLKEARANVTQAIAPFDFYASTNRHLVTCKEG
ncbi:protein of unknown function DUF4116 containing protein [Nitzschia inconspicua]|uniref:Uncharacterized protein n=1 Tax=Nitzschia inconspicua TaxID=303405 RepID=A0A9K3PLI3_9STRA|nr:protein of unknown function DUF4116 containing protein [Nitzschia inconspicua]